MDRGDGGLQLVRPHCLPPAAQRPGDQGHPLGDQGLIPAAAILLGEGDQFPARAGARRAPGLGQQHQRQQPGHLGIAGQQPAQPAGQPDRLTGQIRAGQLVTLGRRVPLVEDQVQHVQHRAEPVAALRVAARPAGWAHGQRHVAGLDGLLGPADPLGHGRLGDQERRGDLRGGQPADRAQGQRDLAGRGQGRVTAAEQQGQRVVAVAPRIRVSSRAEQLGLGSRHRDLILPAAPGLLAARGVHQPPRRHGDQPAPRVVRGPIPGPLQRGGQQGFLGRVLAPVEVPEPAQQRPEDLRRQFAQQVPGVTVRGHPGLCHQGSGLGAVRGSWATRAGLATPRSAPGRPRACPRRSARPARRSRSPPGRSWRCTPWSPGTARR